MRQILIAFFLSFSFIFLSWSGFAQRALPSEGRIVYQVSHASNNALDARPVIREFHVTYNRYYIREEFADEPHRFTITDRRTNRKRYAAGYFKDIPIEIEEDVSPQSFHTVESVQLRSIAGFPTQLYIVFVNNRWTDIFIHANETLQYPEILNLNGLAMEYTMPSEYGILNYRVKRIEAASFDDEWFTFKPLQRITPPAQDVTTAPADMNTKSGLMNSYEHARSNAFKYIDRLQEVSSLRRMLSPELQAERYDKTLLEERELLNELIAEDQRMREAVENYRALRAPAGLDADDLSFLSEAARARRTVVNVKETTQSDLEKAETARARMQQEQSDIAKQEEPVRPDMQWRQSPSQESRTARTPKQTQRPAQAPQPKETPAVVQTPEPKNAFESKDVSESKNAPEPRDIPQMIEVPEEVAQPVEPEQVLKEIVIAPAKEEAPATFLPTPLPDAKAPEAIAEGQIQAEEEPVQIAPEAIQTPAVEKNATQEIEDLSLNSSESINERRDEVPADLETSEGQQTQQTQPRQQEPGFVSLMDFVNRQETADAEEAPARAPRRVISEAPEIADVHGRFLNDETFRLTDFRGKVVVLNFWFIACRPCIIEIPKLNELVADYQSEDVVFLAVGLDGKERIQDFLVRYPFDYQIVPSAMDIAAQFGVSTYPTHIVLDKNGEILAAENGFTDHVQRQIVRAIDGALGR